MILHFYVGLFHYLSHFYEPLSLAKALFLIKSHHFLHDLLILILNFICIICLPMLDK